MKTQARVQFVESKLIAPHQLKSLVLIVLSAFAVGAIPLVYSNKTQINPAPPTEATLWKALYE